MEESGGIEPLRVTAPTASNRVAGHSAALSKSLEERVGFEPTDL
jgi:hypothetical protein